MKTFLLFFHWPEGSVWSNIIASVIWASPAIVLGARKLNKMHHHIKKIHKHLGIDE